MTPRSPVQKPWRIVIVSVGTSVDKDRALERVMDILAKHLNEPSTASDTEVSRESSHLYSGLQ